VPSSADGGRGWVALAAALALASVLAAAVAPDALEWPWSRETIASIRNGLRSLRT